MKYIVKVDLFTLLFTCRTLWFLCQLYSVKVLSVVQVFGYIEFNDDVETIFLAFTFEVVIFTFKFLSHALTTLSIVGAAMVCMTNKGHLRRYWVAYFSFTLLLFSL